MKGEPEAGRGGERPDSKGGNGRFVENPKRKRGKLRGSRKSRTEETERGEHGRN